MDGQCTTFPTTEVIYDNGRANRNFISCEEVTRSYCLGGGGGGGGGVGGGTHRREVRMMPILDPQKVPLS